MKTVSPIRTLPRQEIHPELARHLDAMVQREAQVAAYRGRLYLLVCAGSVPTAGYDLHLQGARIQEGRLTVALVPPDPDLMVAQVISYPTLAIDLGEGPVYLREVVLASDKQNTTLPIKVLGPIG